MIAMFDGECAICIGDIDEGVHDIRYDAVEEGWVHEECLEERELEEGFGSA